MILNNKQTEAVNCSDKIIRVVAGAGSGKTRVLTERIARHLKENENPKDILAITFTNKAANEMKSRVNNFDVNISTIHSLCVKILRVEWKNTKFRILDTDEQVNIIKDIEEKNEIDDKTFKPKEALDFVCKQKLKRLNSWFEAPKDEPWGSLYNGYVEKLESMNAMDFDDLIINTAEILRNDNIRDKWSNKFKYILVDEFQDVDELQYEIIKKLSSINGNLFVVGDGDQMIYSWRGSSETIFNDFDKDFPECKTIILDQNYRSTKNILDKANILIKNNKERIDKDLFTEQKEGSIVRVKQFWDEDEEAKYIIDEIISNRLEHKYSDNAILYRANYLSKNIERLLATNHIPYVIYGGFRFFDRKEIKDLVAYLKFILYRDDISLKRIINVPARKIGKAKINGIENAAYKNRESLWDALKNKHYESKETDNFVELIEKIEANNWKDMLEVMLDETKYIQTLDKEENVENVWALIHEIKNSDVNLCLKEYLDDIALNQELGKTKSDDCVQLMTIHASKGLEFKNVYVIGMSEGKFPKNNEHFEEEERRLAYVAITRAKENLMLCSEKKGYSGFCEPSVFIEEIGGFTESSSQRNFNNWLLSPN